MRSRIRDNLPSFVREAVCCAAAGAFAFFGAGALGCGPNFPNSLLSGNNAQMLSAPIGDFAHEMRRLQPKVPPYLARPSKPGAQSADDRDAELADLRAALSHAGLRDRTAERVVRAHADQRDKLLAYRLAQANWEDQFGSIPNPPVSPPAFPDIHVAEGLPQEFADYFRGALAWHAGDISTARSLWLALLRLPAAQRRFKSTWAAYMLGRSWEETKPGRAATYYQEVRRYVDQGMMDSAGLAIASFGREGLIHYREGDCAEAVALYQQQAAAGDPSALVSLRWTAAMALKKQYRSLPRLARDPASRRVITAYLISTLSPTPVHLDGPIRETVIGALGRVKYFRASAPSWHRYQTATLLWLEAMEKANVRDAAEAELLALAAYQAGEFELTARWLDRASDNTLALWLRAKLFLRDGKVRPAAACIASVVRNLRGAVKSDPASTNGLDGFGFPLWLWADSAHQHQPQDEALGELGALYLARSEYTQSLDALLRAGFWMDAAYVAERVLTADELKSYVEENWNTPPDISRVSDNVFASETSPARQAYNIRYLLARRLARLDRRAEARMFMPTNHVAALDALSSALEHGRDEQAPRAARASALWDAARILRNQGMELVGTEVEPDWAIHEGAFDFGVTGSQRTNSVALRPSTDEIQRARAHGASPEARFHYRYVAAEIAWQAAALMPDNTDETARVLFTAGCWLKARNPKAADRFYKALVNRCRITALGKAADEKRWFPRLKDVAKTPD